MGRFLLVDVKIPRRVTADGVNLVGFEDECVVRQSNQFFVQFKEFLSKIEESSFFFVWLPNGYESGTDKPYPIFLCKTLIGLSGNLMRIQSDKDEDAFASSAWFLSSLSQRWAIYGEHYGSETALFLQRDSQLTSVMLSSFKTLITDVEQALSEIGDQSETEESAAFNREFLANYQMN